MKNKNSKSVYVPINDAEKVRILLKEKNLLRKDLKIDKDDKYIYFPVSNNINKIKIDYKIKDRKFQSKIRKYTNYKEKLKNVIPKNIFNNLPTSFDIIGDIILLRLNKELLLYKRQIGKALLETNKNVKVVCLVEPVKGELRTRKIELIAGEKRTITQHKEYGLTFEVDIKKTYFSPRLSSERKRVSEQINTQDIIVDMFTGVAPFSIMIAKYSNPKIVYAMDKNPYAIKYAKINVNKNKVLNKIQLIKADAKNTNKIIKQKADRVIMNLPFSAHKFFSNALDIANKKCIIHYYDILKEDEIEKRIGFLKKVAIKKGFKLERLDLRKIKTYAPREFYIGIDITAKKMPM